VLVRFLPFFGSGKFIREEMEAFAGLPQHESDASGEEAAPDAKEDANDTWKRTVDRGLEQLERAGLIEYEQDRGLYTFHQTILDHVSRQPALDPDLVRSYLRALLMFHALYVFNHGGDDAAIGRCLENILSTLETAWGFREEERSLGDVVCSVVDRLVDYFERRGLWRLGECWLERAIDLRRSSAPDRDQAAINVGLHHLGLLLYRRGENAKASRLLREAIAGFEGLGDRRNRAASLHGLAGIEQAQGNPAEARRLLSQSIAAFEELGDRRRRAASLHELASIERAQGNLAEARRLLSQSIAVAEELGDRRGRADFLYQLASIEEAQGNLAEARRLFTQSIASLEELGDRSSSGATLYRLASIERDEGNLAEARRLLSQSIAGAEELGDRRGRAPSLHLLASIEEVEGNLAEARRLLSQSIAGAEELGDRRGRAACLHELARIERAQGNLAEARRLLGQSIAVAEELGERGSRAASLHLLASIERDEGNLAEARRLLSESIAVKEELGDRLGRAASLHQLANIERAEGNHAEARQLWSESIAINEEIGDLEGMATGLVMLAQLSAMEGRFEEAVAQSREAVRLLEGIGSFKVAVAKEVLRRIEFASMEAGGHPAEDAQPDVLGTLLGMPAEEARANVEQALEQARADGQAGMEVILLVVRAKKCWEMGNVEASDRALEEAGRALERVEGEERQELEQWLAGLMEQRAKAGRWPSEAVRLHNEGIEKAKNQDTAGALESFQQSANLSRSEGDHRGVAISLFCVGQMLLALGRAREAKERFSEALELAKELGDGRLVKAIQTVAAMAAEEDRS
jgi:tetratricopeptide (TPR) repeat protein